ncbi:MAG: deoxyribodipyrimidine photo-lyase [Candidatus Heimdallarchaeota archaeon]|nr:deoxyribodipyrimidine photo-lyase [Candidatus Heimdallarchaeota archaeon]
MKSVFLFTRDLRVHDNLGLIQATAISDELLPIFILDPRFSTIISNSPKRWEFMKDSLISLNEQLQEYNSRLHIIEDSLSQALDLIYEVYPFDALHINRDFTPLAKRRMKEIRQYCDLKGIDMHVHDDFMLIDPYSILTGSGTPYKVFTAFYNRAKVVEVAEPKSLPKNILVQLNDIPKSRVLLGRSISGGRDNAMAKLEELHNLTNYEYDRDFPSLNGTSGLSSFIRFGVISIREAFHLISFHLDHSEPLLRQLYWREFYTYISIHFPHVFHSPFKKKYQHLIWENDPELFERWKSGNTGFPIVDAGMRQLNTTGKMHNRVRMIVASFLVKDLLIDWRWGERYFAEKLIDYDPAVNNGSWQWAASTGTDAQPYFRIFNPWRQQKRFDADAQYIRRWVTELKNQDVRTIHNAFKYQIPHYPKPIVDHKQRSAMAKDMFKILGSN